MRKHILYICSLLLLLSSQAALSQQLSPASQHNNQAWYQVEMVVFSQIPYAENDNEQWSYVPAFQQPKAVMQLVPQRIFQINQQQTNNNTYPLVTTQQFKLNAEVLHISHNPNYRLIGHFSWIQPIISHVIKPTYLQAANNQTHMDALLSLSKKDYVYVNLKTFFATKISAFQNKTYVNSINDSGIVRFDFHKQFKMKTNELDYIDTPYYGILLQISPFKK